jgi:predicted O-methyltransferase YrrM
MTRIARSRLSRALEGVDGFLHETEAWELYRTGARHRGGTAVEIGSWKGRSTISLALGLAGGIVHAIDPHTGSSEHQHGSPIDTFPEFEANIARAGVAASVDPIRTTSHDARCRFEAGTIDVLFVDGSHDFEDVLLDIDDWTSALRDGAEVAFNDPCWPGVNRALMDRVTARPSPWRRPHHVYNTLFLAYEPTSSWSWSDGLALIRLRLFLRFGRAWWRWAGHMRRRMKLPPSLIDGIRVAAGAIIL